MYNLDLYLLHIKKNHGKIFYNKMPREPTDLFVLSWAYLI